jgi:hypothetical protein
MRWLTILFSVLFKQIFHPNNESTDPVKEMKEFILKNYKRVILSMSVANVLSLMFVAGLTISIVTFSIQYDRTGILFVSALGAGGLGLMLVSMLGFIFFFSASSDEAIDQRRDLKIPQPRKSNLEDALALLINDYVKEKELKREQFRKEESQKEIRKQTPAPSGLEVTPEYDH